jgi:hypothetical protein
LAFNNRGGIIQALEDVNSHKSHYFIPISCPTLLCKDEEHDLIDVSKLREGEFDVGDE